MATAKFKTRDGQTVLDGDRGTFTLAYGSYNEEHERLSAGENKAGDPVVVEVVGEAHAFEHVERVYDEEGIAVGKTSETRWEVATSDPQYPAVGFLPENVVSKT